MFMLVALLNVYLVTIFMVSRHKRHNCRYRIDTYTSQLCHCDERHKSVTRMLLTGIVADVSALEARTTR